MLVHKRTLGVLHSIGIYDIGKKIVIPRTPLYLKDFPDFNPEEWWEIRDSSYLGNKILNCYPFFIPVEKNGRLVNVKPYLPYELE